MSVASSVKKLVYDAVDALTWHRGIPRLISGEPVRFPARWSRYYPSSYEPDKFAFVRKHCRAGASVIDIGAHVGLFTVLMARCVGERGRVFAFEPTPLTREALAQTVRMNHCERIVEIHGEAVARKDGVASFFDTGAALSNANSLVRTEQSRVELTVPTVGLDDFVRARGLEVSFLKIDAEGGELEILEGARATLTRLRPFVQLEIHPVPLAKQPGALESMWQLFEDTKMTVHLDGRVLDHDAFVGLRDAVELQLVPGAA